MAKATATLYPPAPMVVDPDGSANSTKWTNWLRRFEQFTTATGITSDALRVATLLTCAGEAIEEIYYVSGKPATDEYAEVHAIISAHFKPQKDTEAEMVKFRHMAQRMGESIDAFVVRLKAAAKSCEFTNLDLEVKLQVIMTANSTRVRQKGKAETISLNDLMKFARAIEMEAQNSKASYADVKAENIEVKQEKLNRVSDEKPTNSKNWRKPAIQKHRSYSDSTVGKCSKCNRTHKGDYCPAENRQCLKCNQKGHFVACCKSEGTSTSYTRKDQKLRALYNMAPQNETVNADHERSYDSSTSETTFSLGSSNQKKRQCPTVTANVSGTNILFGIDTQASVNAISWNEFVKIENPPTLTPSITSTWSYDGQRPLKTAGKYEALVKANGRQTTTDIHVFWEGHGNLLGYHTCCELGICDPNTFIFSVMPDSNVRNGKKPVKREKQPIVLTKDQEEYKANLVRKFPTVFSGKVGCLNNYELDFHINPNIIPKRAPKRAIPIHLKEAVEKELDKMIADGIIEPATGPTTWISEMVIIPKSETNVEDIRITIDARQANTAIQRERHNTESVEDLAFELNGAQFISSCDIKKGFHQIKIKKSSRPITTFRTVRGLMAYRRLVMGFCNASEDFQQIIAKSLEGLIGVRNLVDDIFVWGSTQEEHDVRLEALLERLAKIGITLNESKCQFNVKSMEFFGINFSANGMSITADKMKALTEAEPPKTKSELRSYLGLASFVGKSIVNFAGKSGKLWKLTTKGANWNWDAEAQEAFDQIKKAILRTALAYFNKKWNTMLEVDASPIGAAAILWQTNPDDQVERKIIACWSVRWTQTECNYSQVEKEALCAVLACERFRLYLIGKPFTIITDNKAVEHIFKNPASNPPPRIARWLLRMCDYRFNITHKPGLENIADYMSRNPVVLNMDKQASTAANQYINMIQNNYGPRAITITKLVEATTHDETCKRLKHAITTNRLESDLKQQFKSVFSDLSISGGGLILKGNRIFVPTSLRAEVLQLAHEGHQGITKTTNLLRNRVWFPRIDSAVAELVGSCPQCEMNTKKKPEPLKMTDCTRTPWTNLVVDFFGPLPDGSEVMVIKDTQSKMVLANEVRSTSSDNVLPVLESAISLMGIPTQIKTDNGPPFNGHEFNEFCNVFGIKHKLITPLHPESNGQCEEFMKNMNKIVKNARNGDRSWKQELNAFLRSYRTTPHSSTGVAPSDIIFRHSNASKLPKWHENSDSGYRKTLEQAWETNTKANQTMKRNADRIRKAETSSFVAKDLVLLDQIKNKKLHNKYLDRWESKQYKVVKTNGSMITIEDESGRSVTRDASWIKKGSPVFRDYANDRIPVDLSDTVVMETSPPNMLAVPVAELRRSSRVSKQPTWYGI